MFSPIPGGSIEDVQGLKCWIPPVGFIWDTFTDKYIRTGVFKRSPKKEDCYWQVDERFAKVKEWEAEQNKRRETNPNFTHAEYYEFKEFVWRHRLGGYWYSNNGVNTYITGKHWYFLSVYHLDTGLPKYYEPQRKLFYAWEYCVEDPESYGLCYVTKRRNGKSFFSGAIGLEAATRIQNFNVGIQSKTDDDAKSLFRKATINPYRKLPAFLKPISDLAPSGKAPAKELKFQSGTLGDDEEELESMIDFRASGIYAYDGQKIGLYIGDEEGKTTLCSIYDRWNVVKYCLTDHEGNVIGKSLHTTTVELMDKGGQAFFDLWLDSDQKDRKEGERTRSGLYKHILFADECRKYDKYGIPDKQAAREQILYERSLIKDPRALSSAKRKEPLDEKEAFQADGSSCVFNPELIEGRIDDLKWTKPIWVCGNFQWEDGIKDTKVIFVERQDGRFKIMYHPPDGMTNLKFSRGDVLYPKNTDMFCWGADTYDHKWVTDKSKKHGLSDGAIVVRKKNNAFHQSMVDGGPCCIYKFRPRSPEDFYEDALMCAVYYGGEGLIENNKSKMIDYFERRGYFGYVKWLPGATTPGIAANQTRNQEIFEITDSFIDKEINTVYFLELVEDWKGFDPASTTKWDLSMAFGYSEMLMRSYLPRRPERKEGNDISRYFSFMKSKRA